MPNPKMMKEPSPWNAAKTWKPAQLATAKIFHSDSEKKVELAEAGERQINAFLNAIDIPHSSGRSQKASELFSVDITYGKTEFGPQGDTVAFALIPKRGAWSKSHQPVRDGLAGKAELSASPLTPGGARFKLLAARAIAKLLPAENRKDYLADIGEQELALRASAQIGAVKESWEKGKNWRPLLDLGISMSEQATRAQWDPSGFYSGESIAELDEVADDADGEGLDESAIIALQALRDPAALNVAQFRAAQAKGESPAAPSAANEKTNGAGMR